MFTPKTSEEPRGKHIVIRERRTVKIEAKPPKLHVSLDETLVDFLLWAWTELIESDGTIAEARAQDDLRKRIVKEAIENYPALAVTISEIQEEIEYIRWMRNLFNR